MRCPNMDVYMRIYCWSTFWFGSFVSRVQRSRENAHLPFASHCLPHIGNDVILMNDGRKNDSIMDP